MRTETRVVYTAAELKAAHPGGFNRALKKHGEFICEDLPWSRETRDSFKAVFDRAGVKLRDWSVGAYDRADCRVEFGQDEAGDLSGARAWAWLENNLFGKLRVRWVGPDRKGLRQYGAAYYAGKIKPCPLTGYCADEDFLEALRAAVRSGDTLKAAFEGLADTWREILEREIEWQSSEEQFLESAEANGWEYYATGEMV